MKRYLILLAILALMLPMFAGVFTIGTGTTGSNTAPFNGLWDNSWTKSVYTLAEINAAGLTGANSITGIGFYVTNTPANYTMLDQRVYVRHSDATAYADTDNDHPDSAQFDAVFQGDLTYNGGGWFHISFPTPFAWNGTQGLEFLFENHDGDYVSGYPNFAYTSTSPNYLMVNKAQDNSFPQGVVGSRSYNRPNIQILTPMVDPPAPTTLIAPINGATFVSTGTSLAWNSVFGATGYNVYFGTTPSPTFVADVGNTTTYSPTGLQPGTTYYWQIVPHNQYGNATGCPVWSFTTVPEGVVTIGNGTVTSRFPLGSFYGYERSASLYTAAEIGAGNKRISSLGWYTTSVSNDAVPTKIYLKSYDGNTITAATWADMIAGATPVYDATITSIPANDWFTVALDNTFDLDSGNNLMVLVERNFGGGGGSAGSTAPAIRATTMSNMHHTILLDNSAPTGVSSAQTTRPNLMFLATSYEITDPPNPAIAVSPQNGAQMVALDAQLSWASGGGAPTGYKLYFGNSTPPAYVGDLGDVTTYNPGTLANGTTYYWQVIPYNATGDATGCPVWSFETIPAGMMTIGDGTLSSSFPFYSLYEAARTQTIITADELNAAGAYPGMIEAIAYDVISVNNIVLNDLMIRMKHTSSETLAAFEEGGFETCFTANMPIASTGWNYFILDNEFIWDGAQNILIDVSFTNSDWNGNSTVKATAAAGKTWARNADGAVGATMTGGAAQTNRPNTRLVFGAPPSGPAAAPILVSPVNGATGMPIEGFSLTWRPDLSNGGMPDYYAVFMAHSEDDILSEEYFETTNANFNPVTEGLITFLNNERWYWAVEAINADGSELSEIRRFDIIAAPPQIAVSPSFLNEELEVGDSSIQHMYISNAGELPLTYSIKFEEVEDENRSTYIPQIQDIQPNPDAALYAERSPFSGTEVMEGTRSLYDLQFSFEPDSGTGEYGVVYANDYIYTSQWNTTAGSCNFYKYDLEGNLLETINIPNAGAIRDFTYDGQYFYGAANSTTIYKFDLNTATLLGTIAAPVAARGISYDPDANGLWITNGWNGPLYLLGMDGTTIRTLTTSAANFAGIAYENISGAPTIWANTQNGACNNTLTKINATDGTVVDTFAMETLFPFLTGDSSAGGISIASGIVPGFATILATSQNEVIYGLELCSVVTWARPVPRTGVVAPGSTATIDIQFESEGLPAGVYEGKLTINHNAPVNPVEVPVSLTLTGDWLPIFSIEPVAWDFDDVEQLNTATKQFTIRNAGGPGLELNAGNIYIADDAEGNFAVQALDLPATMAYNATYRFDVIFTPQTIGAKTATLKVQDNLGRVLHSYPLSGNGIEETVQQVVGLQAAVQSMNNVLLTWGLASNEPASPGWLHYDNGSLSTNIGTGDVASFDVAIKFTAADLWVYAGMQLERIKLIPTSSDADYSLRIWTGSDGSLAPETLVYTQDLSALTINQWNEITLTTPFPLVQGQAIWIGYNIDVHAGAVENDCYPAGADAGPAVIGKGDLIALSGNWVSMATQYNLSNNWNLQTYVNDAPGITGAGHWLNIPVVNSNLSDEALRGIRLSSSGNIPPQRVLRGFNVFRNGTQINSALVASPTYLDEDLEDGTYSYTVQAVYYSQTSAMSDPATATIASPVPLTLPFLETWASSNFTENMWTVGGANWSVGTTGNPSPAAQFSWSPQVVDYDIPLTSYNIDATGIDNVELSFDIYLSNYSISAINSMAWEIWDGTQWNTVGSVNNQSGSFTWTKVYATITEYAANRVFKLRFRAFGEDSYQINYWYIDNIMVKEIPATLPAITDLSVSMVGSTATLNWTAVPGASWYMVYSSENPYADFADYTAQGYVTSNTLTIPANMMSLDKNFIRVTAGAGSFPRAPRLDAAPATRSK